MTKSVTVVVGLDEATIRQFVVSSPTWLKFHPELYKCEWLVFFDGRTSWTSKDLRAKLGYLLPDHAQVVPWAAESSRVEYETQRERMVTGFVFMPAIYCATDYWLKLDTDAIAVDDSAPVWEESWFERDASGRSPVIIASPWGYTKAKGGGGSIEDWARSLEEAGDLLTGCPRLGLDQHIAGKKIKLGRICSWMALFDRSWTAHAAAHAQVVSGGRCRLPVPSEDTWHWYYAARRGDRIERVRFGRRGWTNVPHYDDLRRRVAELMGDGAHV